jgi:hypothetical protein
VQLFIERFVLTALASIVVGVAITNPMKFDLPQRISLSIAAVAFAYFCAHSISRKPSAAVPPSSPPPPNVHIEQHDAGPCSPIVNGVQGGVTLNCNQGPQLEDKSEKPSQPKKQ